MKTIKTAVAIVVILIGVVGMLSTLSGCAVLSAIHNQTEDAQAWRKNHNPCWTQRN
jgi:ABC-type Na+ efflux pump permease subunit